MKKTSFWIILIAAVAVLAAAAAIWLHSRSPGAVANIYLNGECIRSVDLSRVTEPETMTVSGQVGDNVILIERGRICVEHADCPDQICVHMGWLTSEGGMPIVCLPNRLVIEIDDASVLPDGTQIEIMEMPAESMQAQADRRFAAENP